MTAKPASLAFQTTRRPRNAAEAAFFDAAVAAGWSVTKRGMPDFFIARDDEVALVEVKPPAEGRRTGAQLRAYQQIVLNALSGYGVPCYVWSPDRGFVKMEAGADVA